MLWIFNIVIIFIWFNLLLINCIKITQLFTLCDFNKDSLLTEDEVFDCYNKFTISNNNQEEVHENILSKLSGDLSLEEMFDVLDINDDRIISFEEYNTYQIQQQKMIDEIYAKDGLFEYIDVQGNVNTLSKDELTNKMQQQNNHNFEIIDNQLVEKSQHVLKQEQLNQFPDKVFHKYIDIANWALEELISQNFLLNNSKIVNLKTLHEVRRKMELFDYYEVQIRLTISSYDLLNTFDLTIIKDPDQFRRPYFAILNAIEVDVNGNFIRKLSCKSNR